MRKDGRKRISVVVANSVIVVDAVVKEAHKEVDEMDRFEEERCWR